MNDPCEITDGDYLKSLLQLLPYGYAWDWDEHSAGRRLLMVIARELKRLHELLCDISTFNIDRFAGSVTGWSAPEYEALLLQRFGIVADVSDGLLPTSCESHCEAPLLDEGIVFVFVITVDDLSVVTDEVRAYLREYQQSHTHFHFRDRTVQLTTEGIPATTLGTEETRILFAATAAHAESSCQSALYERDWRIEETAVIGGAHAESPLYEQNHVVYDWIADWSYTDAEKLELLNAQN